MSLFSCARRQGAVPFEPLNIPAAWTAEEVRATADEWTYRLTADDIAELGAAADAALASGKSLDQVLSKDEFPLPNLGPKLDAIRKDVSFGRGFSLIKGVPVNEWTRAKSVAAYWIIGLQWGKAVSNNKKGHLVGHIKDLGHDPKHPETRLYATTAGQPYHNDSADIVTLLCLNNAKEGGVSSWSSSISVYNSIARRRPDLAEVLAGPWFYDRKGEVPPGKQPFFEIPVLNFHKGYLSINYSDNYYFASQRHPEVPRLTPAHLEAIREFNALAASDELRVDYVLEQGDIQILSNHSVLHSRGGFVDHEDPDKKRHLLRLWLAPEDERPLPEIYTEILGGSVEVGNRGGIRVEGTVFHVPLEAE